MDKLVKMLPMLLKASGIDLTFEEVEANEEAFVPLGRAASLPGVTLVQIKGVRKDGLKFTGLLVAGLPQ